MRKRIIAFWCALLCFLSMAPLQAVVIDDEPPEITIENPVEGYFHFSGIKLFQTRLNLIADTMGFGGFRIRPVQADISDNTDDPADLNVTLYVDGDVERVMQYNDDTELFEGKWIGPALGTYVMNITAEDSSGNKAYKEMTVWYFCFIPEI